MNGILIRYPIVLFLVPFVSAFFLGFPVFIVCTAAAAIKTALDRDLDPRSATRFLVVVLMSAGGCFLAPTRPLPAPPRLIVVDGVITDGPWRSRSRPGLFLMQVKTDSQRSGGNSARTLRIECMGKSCFELVPGMRISFPAETAVSSGWIRIRTHAPLIRPGGTTFLAPLRALVHDVRQRLRQVLDRTLSPGTAGVAVSILLGIPESVSRETKESFRNTGTLHLLAISGLHVGIVLFSLSRLLSLLAIPERIRLPLQISALITLCLVAGSRIPVLRASLVGGLFLLGTAVGRATDSTAFLFTALFIILLFDPAAPWDISFQLSFAGYGSILAYLKMTVFKPGRSGKVLQAAGLSFSAWLGTAPLAAWHFEQIVPLAPLVNLAAIPLFGVVLTSGLVHLLLASLAPWLSGGSAWITELLLETLLHGLDRLADILPSPLAVPRPSVFFLFFFYGTIALLLLAPARSKSVKSCGDCK